MEPENACLICGKLLVYSTEEKEMKCALCGKVSESYASCESGHYICDECHSGAGTSAILRQCLSAKSKNPIEILNSLMKNPDVHMHGPEHHVLVGSAILTAFRNSGGNIDLPAALAEMKKRGSNYPGGACGYWGCCGAAVSSGMAVSIITESTPLSVKPWCFSNKMTASALEKIAVLGGPRCCKRNSLTAVKEAVAFSEENLGIRMELPENIVCEFSGRNRECIGKKCPYFRSVNDDQ